MPSYATRIRSARRTVSQQGKRNRELREIRQFDADRQLIAAETGTKFAPVLPGPHGRADFGYAYRDPAMSNEAHTAYSRTRLDVERDPKTGFFNIL